MVDELTMADWIAAKAPLDHAPACRPYIKRGGKWVQDYSDLPAVAVILGYAVPVGFMVSAWCEAVALHKLQRGSG